MLSRKEYLDTVREQLKDIHDIKDLPTAGEMMDHLEWMNMLEWVEYVPVIHFEGRNELCENVYHKLNDMVDEREEEILKEMELAYDKELKEIREKNKKEDEEFEVRHDHITRREMGMPPKRIIAPWD